MKRTAAGSRPATRWSRAIRCCGCVACCKATCVRWASRRAASATRSRASESETNKQSRDREGAGQSSLLPDGRGTEDLSSMRRVRPMTKLLRAVLACVLVAALPLLGQAQTDKPPEWTAEEKELADKA